MLKAVEMLLRQLVEGRAVVEVEYSRSVGERGNLAAQQLLANVFAPCPASWRGIGEIPESGLAIRPAYAAHDAAVAFGLKFAPAQIVAGCRCGDVLRGMIEPGQCPLFNRACTPSNPFGPCMVSSEGVCAAHFKYEKRVAA